jgi:hypothetical protein
MTDNERLLWLRDLNDGLSRANDRLFKMLCHKERECVELREANANIRLERDVTDGLLGVAMDELLSRRSA